MALCCHRCMISCYVGYVCVFVWWLNLCLILSLFSCCSSSFSSEVSSVTFAASAQFVSIVVYRVLREVVRLLQLWFVGKQTLLWTGYFVCFLRELLHDYNYSVLFQLLIWEIKVCILVNSIVSLGSFTCGWCRCIFVFFFIVSIRVKFSSLTQNLHKC